MGLKDARPHVRWLGASDDPVLQAIRRQGRLYCCLAHPGGQQSGWFEATFQDGKARNSGTREMIAPSRSRQMPVLRAPMVSAMACLNAGIELSQWIGV